MDDGLKFVFYAIIFVIYIVSQVRKAKKKQEEARALETPTPSTNAPVRLKPLPREVSMNSSTRLKEDDRFKKSRADKSTLFKAKQRKYETNDQKPVYKSLNSEVVEDEGVQVERLLSERMKEEQLMKKDRIALSEERLGNYAQKQGEGKEVLAWLRDKSSLKKAFVATQVFDRKF